MIRNSFILPRIQYIVVRLVLGTVFVVFFLLLSFPRERPFFLAPIYFLAPATQARAGGIITFSDYNTRSADILQDLGWDTLEQRRSKQLAIRLFLNL